MPKSKPTPNDSAVLIQDGACTTTLTFDDEPRVHISCKLASLGASANSEDAPHEEED